MVCGNEPIVVVGRGVLKVGALASARTSYGFSRYYPAAVIAAVSVFLPRHYVRDGSDDEPERSAHSQAPPFRRCSAYRASNASSPHFCSAKAKPALTSVSARRVSDGDRRAVQQKSVSVMLPNSAFAHKGANLRVYFSVKSARRNITPVNRFPP